MAFRVALLSAINLDVFCFKSTYRIKNGPEGISFGNAFKAA